MKNLIFIPLVFLIVASCDSPYYTFWEKLGWEKRDLLASEIKGVQSEQKEVKKDFESVLDRFRNQYDFKGGKIEELYDQLRSDLDEAKSKQNSISEKAKDIRSISRALFKEWQKEALQLQNPTYRRDSLQKLQQTKKRYKELEVSLNLSEKQLDQVVKQLEDQVIYLKHNLNAKSLKIFASEIVNVQREIGSLIQTIEKSIQRSHKFEQVLI